MKIRNKILILNSLIIALCGCTMPNMDDDDSSSYSTTTTTESSTSSSDSSSSSSEDPTATTETDPTDTTDPTDPTEPTTPPTPPTPGGLYDNCDAAIASHSLSGLWDAVKVAANTNYSKGSYDGLYTWYASTDKRADGYLNDYYSNITNYTFNKSDQCGNYSKEGDCYNREHTIPQSWWGGGTNNQGCDVYIVLPTDGKINGIRSNYPLGETNGSSKDSAGHYSKFGTSNFDGYSGSVFEVNDRWKGDFARIYFYALTKWNDVSFTQDSQHNGKIVFQEGTTRNASNNFGLTSYAVALFKKWHKQDPVDDWELARNNAAASKQGNRNPYIDHPEYADYLWCDKPI